jgi:Flp pilus assembly protein TadG
MRRSNPSTDPEDDLERGSAALEFIVVGMLLLVPLVYLIVTLGLIQGSALGVEAGARHVARAVATAVDTDEARDRADLVVASVVREYGLDASRTVVETRCRPAGTTCPRAGATLVVTLRTTVALPLVPPVLGLDRLASVPVESTTVHKVSRVWGSGS